MDYSQEIENGTDSENEEQLSKDSEDYYYNLNIIRENIEKMNKFNQVEILKILSKHSSVMINENKYGVHINLSELDISIIKELSEYVKYVSLQENYINDIEKQKEIYKTTFFNKK